MMASIFACRVPFPLQIRRDSKLCDGLQQCGVEMRYHSSSWVLLTSPVWLSPLTSLKSSIGDAAGPTCIITWSTRDRNLCGLTFAATGSAFPTTCAKDESSHHTPLPQFPQFPAFCWHQSLCMMELSSLHQDAPDVNGGQPQAGIRHNA